MLSLSLSLVNYHFGIPLPFVCLSEPISGTAARTLALPARIIGSIRNAPRY